MLFNLLLLFTVFFFGLSGQEHQTDKPWVLVSVAPYKFFVEKIAKETINVHLMVPAGASSHTYEPTTRQILNATKGDLWFRIGESFEDRAIRALQSHHAHLKVIDLRKGLNLITKSPNDICHCCPGGEDLHFWLSPRLVKIQAKTILDALSQTYPEQASFFKENYTLFLNELDKLDSEIQNILKPLTNRNILVSHPAYAYFCRDYHLEQYSIEMEGKDPSSQQMTKLLNTVKQLQIHTIYIQMQYHNKAAKLVADIIGAKLVVLDPYSEDYINSLLQIANAFANGS